MREIVMVLLVSLLVGCTTLVERPGSSIPQKEIVSVLSPIERIQLGMTSSEVRAIFGEPTRTETTKTIGINQRLSYDGLGFAVRFVDDKLISGSQWKGSISVGIAIGDSRERVSSLGIEIERWTVDTEIGYIRRGTGVIKVYIENGRVIRFGYEPVADGL